LSSRRRRQLAKIEFAEVSLFASEDATADGKETGDERGGGFIHK